MNLVKLLGNGEIDKKVTIEVHACSISKEKVEAAGGSCNHYLINRKAHSSTI
jgi:ribosomal protein L15